jgi:hypothetical protein
MMYDQNNVDLESDPHINLADNPNMQRMLDDIDALMEAGDVALVTFDFYKTMIGFIEDKGHIVTAIPYPAQRISVVDVHPNANGNQELADALAPVVQELVATHCES